MKKITIPETNINLIIETVSENVTDELVLDVPFIEKLSKERNYEHCFYCDCLVRLSPQAIGDHFPIPKRRGGTLTVPCCVSCHDMKDRFSVNEWPAEWIPKIMADLPKLSRETRIFLAKSLMVFSDYLFHRERLEKESDKKERLDS